METGELKALVIQGIRHLGEASVSELIDFIDESEGREYVYSTIATVLRRLEDEGFVSKKKKKKGDRKKTYYQLRDSAHKHEASSFLKDYITKFGDVGIRHLSDMMGSDISMDEIDELRQKIMES